MKKLILLFSVLVLSWACAVREGIVLTIFHTNDIQGFYWARNYAENDNKETGGLAVLKEMLDKYNGHYLFFDSGDWFSKTQEGQIGKFESAAELMGKIKYTAVTLSAADFALGWDNMGKALEELPFPVVISNLRTREGAQPKNIKKYLLLEHNGIKIAVLGLLSKTDFPKIQRNAQIKAVGEAQTLRALVPRMKEEGADVIILLSSLGFETEDNIDEKTIAEEFPEINIILGGRGDISSDGWEKISNAYVSRAKSMLFEAEKIKLTLDKNKNVKTYEHYEITLDKDVYGEDETLREGVAAAQAAVKKITGRKIATLPFDLKSHSARQSPLGVYTADCIRRWASNNIGIINSDLFLADFAQGPMTDADLLNAIPFNDRVMLLKMRGDELKNALESSIEAKNNWPHTAGININYDPLEPFGKRIKKITLSSGAVLKDSALYSISTSDNIVAGGFGHNEFLNVFEFKNTDRTVRDILRWCLLRQKEFTPPQINQWKAVK
jgi:2',3'-cyclic-nucleotide 2'-phosphodiesterase/3'-nucleotidase